MDRAYRSVSGITKFIFFFCFISFLLTENYVFGGTDWAGPESVLVVFNDRWPDEDGNGKSDSRDVAEYYAARRGIPAGNLLSVQTSTDYTITYRDFYREILSPVHQKLETVSDGVKLKKSICYILTCYGVPVCADTHLKSSDNPFRSSYSCNIRSLDQFLMDVYRQMRGGVTPRGAPKGSGGRDGALLGDSRAEVSNLYADAVSLHTRRESIGSYTFKAVRDRGVRIPAGSYLVTRLDGMNAEIAKGLVDNALYAEKYLKPQASPAHPYRMQVLIDSDEGRRHGHERSAAMMRSYLAGELKGSPWHPDRLSEIGLKASPFDIVPDWGVNRKEVGEEGRLPAVRGIVSRDKDSVSRYAVDLAQRPSPFGINFFAPGMTVMSDDGSMASVLAVDAERNRLLLDDAALFRPGGTVTWQWAGQFPLSPAFIYTFYALGAYRDVYTFPPGALGKHMDSASGRNIRSPDGAWAARALIRNITSTQGAVAEPFSLGEARMDAVMAALSLGCNAADAWYNGLTYGNRWMGVVISDPLYAPLRGLESREDDVTAPVIGRIRAVHISSSETEIQGELAGENDAGLDVCRFTVEYGPDASYGNVWKSFSFPGPFDGKWRSGRRCLYSRRFSCRLSGLEAGSRYHYRVTAADPYGNRSSSDDLTFTAGRTENE